MKRTLLEIFALLAVVVLLASFHRQLGRLQERTFVVEELGAEIRDASEHQDERESADEIREGIIRTVEQRLVALEERIANTSRTAEEASSLRDEVESVQRQTALFRAEVERDVSRAVQIVDTYQNEFRSTTADVQKRARSNAEQIVCLLEQLSAPKPESDARTLTTKLLLPTVQLNGSDTVGSGTLVCSRPVEGKDSGAVQNFVLTSYHVVRNIFADTPSARRDGIEVTVYGEGENDENLIVRGDMIAHDVRIDAALVKLRSEQVFGNVARVLSREEARNMRTWDTVFAIGCPLGNDPIPTRGELSSTDNVLSGANYWMINAPTYYGNSGGGVFTRDDRLALLGVFSKIYTHGRTSPVVVPHMGLCTPIPEIYAWLDREDLAWVIEAQPQLDAIDLGALAAPPK